MFKNSFTFENHPKQTAKMETEQELKKESKSAVITLRISEDSRRIIDEILKVDKNRKVIDLLQLIVEEYAPIKDILVRPMQIQMEIKMKDENPIRFTHSNPEELEMEIGGQYVAFKKSDKKALHQVIANLLMFTNTIS